MYIKSKNLFRVRSHGVPETKMSQFLYLVLSLAVNRVAGAAGSARNLSGIPCGQPGGGSRQARIMGGAAADILQFPYAVSLRNNSGEHYCAGSLVSFFIFHYLSPKMTRKEAA